MKIIQSTVTAPRYSYLSDKEAERSVFFDIETTGLSPKASSLYLIGAMHYNVNSRRWQMTQWFADDYRSEADILHAFFEYLKPFQRLYHFNGATFDIPYLLAKCEKHSLSVPAVCTELLQGAGSIDILKEIRPLKKKLGLLKANQTALEKWLHIRREDDFTGGELNSVYTEYMQKKLLHKEGTDKLEKLLLLHNHDDIAGMLEVASLLSYRDALSPVQAPEILDIRRDDKSLRIYFSLPHSVPRQTEIVHNFPPAAELIHDSARLILDEQTGILQIPLYTGQLKFFFPNYPDYYYLPLEDTAIHKSVAAFVDKAYRKKATASTCYTRREGIFLPELSKTSLADIPVFYSEYKAKTCFYQLPEQEDNRKALLRQYLFHDLPSF